MAILSARYSPFAAGEINKSQDHVPMLEESRHTFRLRFSQCSGFRPLLLLERLVVLVLFFRRFLRGLDARASAKVLLWPKVDNCAPSEA